MPQLSKLSKTPPPMFSQTIFLPSYMYCGVSPLGGVPRGPTEESRSLQLSMDYS